MEPLSTVSQEIQGTASWSTDRLTTLLSDMDPDELALRTSTEELQAAVVAAVDVHGKNTATVSSEVGEGTATITVEPFNHEAASVKVLLTSDKSTILTFGHTSLSIDANSQTGINELQSALALVFRGDFTEYGPGFGESRFRLPTGEQVWLGAKKSPLQRRFGPKRHYEPYN